MNLDAVFFLTTTAAILGQFSDARTTEVGLDHGFNEGNSVGAKLIKKLGISDVYAIKCGVLPFLGGLLLAFNHELAGIYTESFIAGAGFVFGVLNFLKLRKSNVTFKEVFLP